MRETLTQMLWQLAKESTERPIQSLDPANRARLLLALLGLIILAVGSGLIIWLSGRAVRRWIRGDTGLGDVDEGEHERALSKQQALWYARSLKDSASKRSISTIQPPSEQENEEDREQ